MANLLTSAQEAQIQQAFLDTMDTYSDTPILIKVAGFSMDAWNEDRTDLNYTDYSLFAYLEFSNNTKVKVDSNFLGKWDKNDVRIMIHLDYLEAVGLFDPITNKVNINPTTDYVVANGQTFELDHESIDGAYDRRQVNCILWAKRVEKYAS